jgi:large subunit ribosomal protein L2
MPVKTFRPLTPSTRYITISSFHEITKSKPERSLIEIRKKSGGRNMYGRVTARGIGGGHKQFYRNVDFKRAKLGMEAEVIGIEYDPIRTARLALLKYKDGDLRYIIAPVGLKIGAKLMNGPTAPPEIGNSLPLGSIPISSSIHNIEMTPGRGGQMVRTAGGAATLMSRDETYSQIRLPSGEIRRVHNICFATIGQVGNLEHENVVLGKADVRGIAAFVASAAAWRATPLTIRTAAAPANPRAAAAGNN